MLNLQLFAQAIVTLRSTSFMPGNLKFVGKGSVHRRCFVQMQISISHSCINLLNYLKVNGRDEVKKKKKEKEGYFNLLIL